MPGGRIVGMIFYICVLFAGVSSIINLYEAPVAFLQEKLNMKRIPSVALIGGIGGVVALLIQPWTSQWMDLVSIYICPLGALLAGIMFFWVLRKETALSSVEQGRKTGSKMCIRDRFMDRYPAELSGGQQQRVAIARTLAPEPTVLFMDEPLSNLDAKLRLEMRYELQRLHVETGSIFVYVTHDQMEAMTLATKICLINNGVLQQYEAVSYTHLDVYKRQILLIPRI